MQAVTTTKMYYNPDIETLKRMKSLALTLMGLTTVAGNILEITSLGESGVTVTTTAGNKTLTVDAGAAPTLGTLALTCAVDSSSTTEYTDSLNVPNDLTVFRGEHVLKCTLDSETYTNDDTSGYTYFLVKSTGTCADRTFPLAQTAVEVIKHGTFDFTPSAPVDDCPAGRLKTEAILTSVRVTMRGDIANPNYNQNLGVMTQTFDLSGIVAKTFNVGLTLPTVAEFSVASCTGGDLCIGSAKYEYLDASGNVDHTAFGIGWTFPDAAWLTTDVRGPIFKPVARGSRRFMKWQMVNALDAVSNVAFNEGTNRHNTAIYWCADGDDDINTCHSGPREINDTHVYFSNRSRCENRLKDTVADTIQYTSSIGGDTVLGQTQIICPDPMTTVVMDALKIDPGLDFTIDNDLEVTLDINPASTFDGYTATQNTYMCGKSGDSEPSCSASGVPSCTNATITGTKPYQQWIRDLDPTKGRPWVLSTVTFTDTRQMSGVSKTETFCTIQKLGLTFKDISTNASATIASVARVGVEAHLDVQDLKWTEDGQEGCNSGKSRVQVVIGITQVGGWTTPITPDYVHLSGATYQLKDGSLSPTGFILQMPTCTDLCENHGSHVTKFKLSFDGEISYIEYEIATTLNARPGRCSGAIEVDDDSLATPMSVNIAERGAAAECPNAIPTNTHLSDLTVGDVLCIDFAGNVDTTNNVDTTLKIDDVQLNGEDVTLDPPSAGKPIQDDATLREESMSSGAMSFKGSMVLTDNEVTTAQNPINTLTVFYTESFHYDGSDNPTRRRLRADFILGNKIRDKSASFTVLPASITVPDEVEDPVDTDEPGDATSVMQIVILAVGVITLLVLVWFLERLLTMNMMANPLYMHKVVSRHNVKAYKPVAQFQNKQKY